MKDLMFDALSASLSSMRWTVARLICAASAKSSNVQRNAARAIFMCMPVK